MVSQSVRQGLSGALNDCKIPLLRAQLIAVGHHDARALVSSDADNATAFAKEEAIDQEHLVAHFKLAGWRRLFAKLCLDQADILDHLLSYLRRQAASVEVVDAGHAQFMRWNQLVGEKVCWE